MRLQNHVISLHCVTFYPFLLTHWFCHIFSKPTSHHLLHPSITASILCATATTLPSRRHSTSPLPSQHLSIATTLPLHCRHTPSPLPSHSLPAAVTAPPRCRHNTLLQRYFQKNGIAFLRLCTRQRHLITFSDKHAQHRPAQCCTFQILFVILPYTYPTPATRAYSRRHRGGE